MNKIIYSLIFVLIISFLSDICRGYDATGGELLLLFIPLFIASNEIKKREEKIKRQKEYITVLEKNLYN